MVDVIAKALFMVYENSWWSVPSDGRNETPLLFLKRGERKMKNSRPMNFTSVSGKMME